MLKEGGGAVVNPQSVFIRLKKLLILTKNNFSGLSGDRRRKTVFFTFVGYVDKLTSISGLCTVYMMSSDNICFCVPTMKLVEQ